MNQEQLLETDTMDGGEWEEGTCGVTKGNRKRRTDGVTEGGR